MKISFYLCTLENIHYFLTILSEILKKIMKTIQENYISPEVKFVEVIVEKGFLISGIVINDRYGNEKHEVDEVEEW